MSNDLITEDEIQDKINEIEKLKSAGKEIIPLKESSPSKFISNSKTSEMGCGPDIISEPLSKTAEKKQSSKVKSTKEEKPGSSE